MKSHNLFFLAALSLMMLSSCSPNLSYFTQDVYDQNHWTEAELKRIQFYVSQDIVLKRELTGAKSEIISGKIKMEKGRKIEEVVIKKGTPGVYTFSPKDDRFAVSFEDDRYLIFGPSPKNRNRYVLRASEWNRNSGKVNYDGKLWRVSSDAAYAALLVDMKKINRTDVNSRTAKGRRVGG